MADANSAGTERGRATALPAAAASACSSRGPAVLIDTGLILVLVGRWWFWYLP